MDSNSQALSKIVVVTGAGSGIGKHVSLALLREGYSVVLAGRHRERLEQTAVEAKENAPRALVVPTDVTDPASVQALFATINRTFHRLDLLFNNAGLFGPSSLLEDLSFEDWQSMINTNLTGAFLCTQEAFKIMKAQRPRGGRIINNGSISAHSPRPNSAAYTATKHAITGLTKATSLDGRKYDIACGQIDIGNADTQMAQTIVKTGAPQPDGTVRPEPLMNLQDVERAVIYMASLPLEANVQFMTVMATKMPLVGRG